MQANHQIARHERRLAGPRRKITRAIVVFVDETECFHLRWLKRGFRHCFAAIRHQDHWIICDPLKNRIEFLAIKIPSDVNLCHFYYERGHTVLISDVILTDHNRWICPEILTCVGIVKKIIGFRSFWIMTPWQLFQALNRTSHQWRLVN